MSCAVVLKTQKHFSDIIFLAFLIRNRYNTKPGRTVMMDDTWQSVCQRSQVKSVTSGQRSPHPHPQEKMNTHLYVSFFIYLLGMTFVESDFLWLLAEITSRKNATVWCKDTRTVPFVWCMTFCRYSSHLPLKIVWSITRSISLSFCEKSAPWIFYLSFCEPGIKEK